MKEISLIGSTGSVGRQCLDVVRRYPEKFHIKALVAGGNSELFLKQVLEFRPSFAVLADERAGEKIRDRIPSGTNFAVGRRAALDAACLGDTVMIAASGFSGLEYTLKAIESGRDIALANKESLVCGGELVMNEIKKRGVRFTPVDSEHSAIWQALSFERTARFRRLIITASGGPFYGYTPRQLEEVTISQAMNHPTWKMGKKITVDSATLLNKGFEVIEAKWLFDAPLERIETVIQPTSIIHSMVEFCDGAIMAQMSYPTMEIPIQLALTYPERMETRAEPLDFTSLSEIKFLPLERKKYPCYDLALSAIEQGYNLPCALNAAGEIAVMAFIDGRIRFTQIAEVISEVLSGTKTERADDFSSLLSTDAAARELAEKIIKKRDNI